MRYRRRADFVDAEQWGPGVEIPGVVRTGEVGVVTGTPSLRQVRAGDWVVSIAGRIIGVMQPQAFEAMYVAEGPPPGLKTPDPEPQQAPEVRTGLRVAPDVEGAPV